MWGDQRVVQDFKDFSWDKMSDSGKYSKSFSYCVTFVRDMFFPFKILVDDYTKEFNAVYWFYYFTICD